MDSKEFLLGLLQDISIIGVRAAIVLSRMRSSIKTLKR